MRVIRSIFAGVGLLLIGQAIGCNSHKHDLDVVAYAALDRGFVAPIFDDFKAETGVTVLAKYDTESTKTVGLAEAIIQEAKRPRCDVFWNNEILHTIRLERLGLLDEYHSPAADDFPEMYRSPKGAWHALAARARVLIVNTEKVSGEKLPRSILDLASPEWKGQVGIAKPLFGTTATHAACLFATWGDDKAKEFFRTLKANDIEICAGNKAVAVAVGAGNLAFGLTDTDDAIDELDKKHPVAIIYPDQLPDQLGALFIPNTVAIIKGCPHPPAARLLVDYAISPEVEERLATGMSAQIPLGSRAKAVSRLHLPPGLRQMQVDFGAAADAWEKAKTFLSDEFAR
ncbi:MAG TPA: extracellular solute-binding protein [Pirellulales bacterium]|jgi:iron(III) transport system substrate-binding protein